MPAPAIAMSPYQYLKPVARSALSQTWVARDTRRDDKTLYIIQKLDFHTDNVSLMAFGQTLLGHKVQTLQPLLKELASAHTIHDSFSDGQSFYIVQSLVRGRPLHRLRLQDPATRPPLLPLLSQILMLLQQSYRWGLGSCCLHPGDLIQCQADNSWVWTGTGIFKTIVQQVSKPTLALTDLFPKETAAYFSPEFLQGRFDVRSDLYTVGVAMIQALTQLPLADLVYGNDGYFTIRRNWYRQRQLPDVLVATLNRMVNANPLKRYSTIAEVLDELEQP
ncbi:MAG: hypothetical protein AAFX51_02970 [Cyanobacteria bacterium J06636_28]